MDLNLLKFSIVVMGDKHNPTIIDRNFLSIQEIVSSGWNLEVLEEGILTSPQLARVPYKQGVLIQVEPTSAQFSDEGVGDPAKSVIDQIAKKFVHTLRHVHYKGVGTHFNCLIENPTPEQVLKERFLRKGDWDTKGNELDTIGLRLIYKVDDGLLSISLDAGTAWKRDDDPQINRPVIFVGGNFYRDLGPDCYPADEKIHSYIDRIPSDWKLFISLSNKLIG